VNAAAAAGTSAPVLFLHADAEAWVRAAVTDIVGGLQRALEADGEARLLLSGGSTPAPVHRALAREALDWGKIAVGLVDERWLAKDDLASNARLLRETLLEEGAPGARFEPMKLPPHHRIEDSVREANRHSVDGAVCVLGMGEDGHTASLFPGIADLQAAFDSLDDYIAIDAGAAPVAQPWPRRISLTPAGLARTGTRLLLVRGARKREVLLRALAGDDAFELPVRAAFALPGEPLRIHWAP
jgi:6-phosphogluconolactonase